VKGHANGLAWVYPERRLAFVPIPKCASTSMKRLLDQHGFESRNLRDLDDPHDWMIWTVIRDPLARFVSGWSEFLARASMSFSAQKLHREIEIGRLTVDEHTQRQSWFVDGLPLDAVIRFECLAEDMAVLGRCLGFDFSDLPVRNSGNGQLKQAILACLTEADRASILHYYAADVILHANRKPFDPYGGAL